jgi:superfamily II DNA or RNA helicase
MAVVKVNEGCALETSPIKHVRADRVEVLAPSSDGTFGGVCPDGYVYNFEVEDTHNYVVNGTVVSNCHHAASPTWSKVLQVVPAFFRLGASDTMCEDDPVRWHTIRGLVGPIRSRIESRQLIKDVALSMASSGRLAKPHIFLVDVPAWSGKFRNVPHVPEIDTEAFALISGQWKKGIYAGPVFESDPDSPDGIKRDKNGDPVKLDNYHRLVIDGVERDVESRWCLLQRTRDRAIIRFNERNWLITQWTKYYSEKGWPTLVVCTPTLHILILKSLITAELGADKVKILYSEHDSRERDEVFAWLKATPGAVLISSLVKEGVSLPEIRGGVIADYVAGWEPMRQLLGRFIRKKPSGENYACITVFVERQHPKLLTKSIQMLDKLSKTRGFVFYHPATTPDSIPSAQKFDAV